MWSVPPRESPHLLLLDGDVERGPVRACWSSVSTCFPSMWPQMEPVPSMPPDVYCAAVADLVAVEQVHEESGPSYGVPRCGVDLSRGIVCAPGRPCGCFRSSVWLAGRCGSRGPWRGLWCPLDGVALLDGAGPPSMTGGHLANLRPLDVAPEVVGWSCCPSMGVSLGPSPRWRTLTDSRPEGKTVVAPVDDGAMLE